MTRWLAVPLLAFVTSACVTINIYFPAAAAEEAARTIVRDVLKEGEATPEPGSAQDKQSSRADPHPVLVAIGHVLEVLVPPAHAAEADININTAGIRAIRASMQGRQSKLARYYQAGAIGFDSRGNVAIRDLAAAPLAERNQLKQLVADENADRSRLYQEIARANGHPEWEPKVRATFARVWVEEAPGGYWYQTAGGAWQQR